MTADPFAQSRLEGVHRPGRRRAGHPAVVSGHTTAEAVRWEAELRMVDGPDCAAPAPDGSGVDLMIRRHDDQGVRQPEDPAIGTPVEKLSSESQKSNF